MKRQFKIFALLIAVVTLCVNIKAQSAEIKWDKWGVPHIHGHTETDVYYGFGWAQMKAHGNVILKMYARSRGRSAEYWGGAENVERDRVSLEIDVPARARAWFEAQSSQMKKDLTSFAAGMNAYCAKNPEKIDPENKVVLPVLPTDPLAQLQVSYHIMVGAFALQPQATQWKSAGSNAWAIAPKRSASGNAMLMMQPHPPWTDEYLFFESHLQGPKMNVYGISLLGLPMIAMGFNEDLGWGLTFNQADAMDLIEIDLRGDKYLVDGKWKKLALKDAAIKVKDGVSETIQIRRSDFGYLVEQKGNKALALRLSGLDRPHLIRQFSDMARSKDLKEFQRALSQLQLPLQNIVYADKAGSIFYLNNGIIPRRPNGIWADWAGIIPSSKPGTLVTDFLSYDELPKLVNPRSGFVANSNNDPWTSTYPFELNPKDYPAYVTDTPFKNFDLRSARSIKMLTNQEKLSFEQLVEMQSSTRSELADRTIDELVEFGMNSENDISKKASIVLKNWDRKLDTGSRGSVLFANWYFAARKGKMFEKTFSTDDPLNTPNTLTLDAKAKLLDAAQQTIKSYGQLDVAWGDVYKTSYADKTLNGGLGLSELGSFNAGFYSRAANAKWNLAGGSAFTSVIEFGNRIRAKGILGYGNATQKNSPFRGDQLQLMIDRKLRDIWFYQTDIDKNTVAVENLRGKR